MGFLDNLKKNIFRVVVNGIYSAVYAFDNLMINLFLDYF